MKPARNSPMQTKTQLKGERKVKSNKIKRKI